MISQFFSERLGHPTFPRVVKRPTFRKNNIYQMQIRTKIMSQSGHLFISCGIEFLSAVGTFSSGKQTMRVNFLNLHPASLKVPIVSVSQKSKNVT